MIPKGSQRVVAAIPSGSNRTFLWVPEVVARLDLRLMAEIPSEQKSALEYPFLARVEFAILEPTFFGCFPRINTDFFDG